MIEFRPRQVSPVELSLRPGQTLFREGDIAGRLYQLRSGWIKLMRSSVNGKDTITELIFPGDYFDLTSALDGHPSAVSAAALSSWPALVCSVDRFCLRNDSQLLSVVQKQFLSRMRLQQDMIVTLATEPVERRVTLILKAIALRADRKMGSHLLVPMPLTRQEFGELLGTSTETMIRILSDFRRRGVVEWKGADLICKAELFESMQCVTR